MDDATRTRAAQGLMRAIAAPTDRVAAKMGEDNPLVMIKRNSDRVNACPGHDFEPVPDWRTCKGPFLWLKVRCRRCEGEMNADAVMDYLRGYAHGTGQDVDVLAGRVFPTAAAGALA